MRTPCETLKAAVKDSSFPYMPLRKDLQQAYTSSSYFEKKKKLLGLHDCSKILPVRFGHLKRPFLLSIIPEVFPLRATRRHTYCGVKIELFVYVYRWLYIHCFITQRKSMLSSHETKLIETKFPKKYLPLSFLLPSVSRRTSGCSHTVAGYGRSSVPV